SLTRRSLVPGADGPANKLLVTLRSIFRRKPLTRVTCAVSSSTGWHARAQSPGRPDAAAHLARTSLPGRSRRPEPSHDAARPHRSLSHDETPSRLSHEHAS